MSNEVIKSTKELIDKEFYVATNITGLTNGNIFQYCSKLKDALYYTGGSQASFNKNGGCFVPPYRKATSEESHWLKEMIKKDKFITKEKAMETFKPLVGKYFIPLYNDLDCSDCEIDKCYRIESEDDKCIWFEDADGVDLYISKDNLVNLIIGDETHIKSLMFKNDKEENRKESLLKEAKIKYPIGTEFIGVYGSCGKNQVLFNDHEFLKNNKNDNIIVTVKNIVDNDCKKWTIYSEEKGWAQIVSYVKKEKTDNLSEINTNSSIFRFDLKTEEQSSVEVQKLNINIFNNIKQPIKLNNYGN